MSTSVDNVSSNTPVTNVPATTSTTTTSTPDTSVSTDFADLIKSFLPGEANRNVSEEELFSAGVGERISKLVGDDALEKYKTGLASEQASLKAADGYVPVEQATINTLKKLVADGDLTAEQGDQIYTSAFEGAQLDDNKAALFDDRGSSSDPTVSIAAMDAAISKISQYITSLGDTAPKTLMSLATASASGRTAAAASGGASGGASGKPSAGSTGDGLIFKPVTNNEGILAVLPSTAMTHNIASVSLFDSAGKLIETGKKNTGNGTAETGREKWVFSKPGSSYPANIKVSVTLLDGSSQSYDIADPSKRYD